MNVLAPQRAIAVIVFLSSQHQITTLNEGNFTKRKKHHFCYGNSYSSIKAIWWNFIFNCFCLKEEFINGNYSFVVICLRKDDWRRKTLVPGNLNNKGKYHKATCFCSTAKAMKAFSSTYKFVPVCTTCALSNCWFLAPSHIRGMDSVCWKVFANLELDWNSSHLVCCRYLIYCSLNPSHKRGRSTGRCINYIVY